MAIVIRIAIMELWSFQNFPDMIAFYFLFVHCESFHKEYWRMILTYQKCYCHLGNGDTECQRSIRSADRSFSFLTNSSLQNMVSFNYMPPNNLFFIWIFFIYICHSILFTIWRSSFLYANLCWPISNIYWWRVYFDW